MDSEIIKLLKSPQVKAFGGLVAVAMIVVVGSIVYRNYITNKVLGQQAQINKYVLKKLRGEYTPGQQLAIEDARIPNKNLILN